MAKFILFFILGFNLAAQEGVLEKHRQLIDDTKKFTEELAKPQEKKEKKESTEEEKKKAQERIDKIKKSFAEIIPDGELWKKFEEAAKGKDPVELTGQFPESWLTVEKETVEIGKKVEAILNKLPKDLSLMIKEMTKDRDPRDVMKILPDEWKNAADEKLKITPEQMQSFFKKFGESDLLEPKKGNEERKVKESFKPKSNSPNGEGGMIAGNPAGPDKNQIFRTPKERGGKASSTPMKKPIGKAAKLTDAEMRALAAGKDKISEANEGGNPSFGIKTPLGDNSYGNCQATLYQVPEEPAQRDDECLLATARHCVMKNNNRWSMEFMTAYGLIEASDVKVGEAEGAANDIAKVTFSGDVCRLMKKKGVPVLPLKSVNPRGNEETYLGTRYFNRLHYVPRVRADGNQISVSLFDLGVHTGDSGGGLFTRDEKGNLCLSGVLSCAEDQATVHHTPDGKPTVGALNAWYSGDTRFLRQGASGNPVDIHNTH